MRLDLPTCFMVLETDPVTADLGVQVSKQKPVVESDFYFPGLPCFDCNPRCLPPPYAYHHQAHRYQ